MKKKLIKSKVKIKLDSNNDQIRSLDGPAGQRLSSKAG